MVLIIYRDNMSKQLTYIRHWIKLEAMYLDYFNNFLTLQAFSDHYGITKSSAGRIVRAMKNKGI